MSEPGLTVLAQSFPENDGLARLGAQHARHPAPQGGVKVARVKVQNNTSSTGYDIVYFYYGNNGNSFGTEPTTFALTPFTSARMSLTLVGTVATFMLDTNFDGIADQTFTRTDVPIGSLGTGIGLGFFGATTLDNFSVVPEPSTVWLMLLGAGVVAFSYRAHVRRRPIAGPTI